MKVEKLEKENLPSQNHTNFTSSFYFKLKFMNFLLMIASTMARHEWQERRLVHDVKLR